MDSVIYSALNPANITDDEVIYELRVRGIFNQQHNQAYRRTNLNKCIQEEVKSQSMTPTQIIFEKSDAVNELQICRNKVSDLVATIAFENRDVWVDRAAHVKNRLKRLSEALPTESAACTKIFQELATAINTFNDQQKQQNTQQLPNTSSTWQSNTLRTSTPTTTTISTAPIATTTATTASNTSHSGSAFI